MKYEPRDYSSLIGMKGFSESLLKNHFTLYEGYVANTNKIVDTLRDMLEADKTGLPEYAELKRRLGWEFNGMRLHEYYFDNLGGDGRLDTGVQIAHEMREDFGSYVSWEKDFRATAGIRGIGWVVLYRDRLTRRLTNQWINEHDVGHPAGGHPILVLDVFEHAFMLDYGLKKGDYVDAFLANVDWKKVEERHARILGHEKHDFGGRQPYVEKL